MTTVRVLTAVLLLGAGCGYHLPGTGEVHYTRVLKQLHDLGYRGHVGLECRPRGSELDAARAVNRIDQW